MASLEERVAERIAKEFHARRVMTPTREKLYRGELLTPEEAEEHLGKNTFDAYSYAHKAAEGLFRRCGNVAISHMFEVGERANDLGFGLKYVIPSLLHDVIEDKSKNIEDAHHWAEDISAKFGDETARDVVVETNHYAILIEGIERLTIGTPATGYSNDMLLNALNRLRTEAGDGVIAGFERYFSRLDDIIRNLDIGEVNNKIGRDNRYSVFDELKSRAYRLYIADIFADAKKRYEGCEERYSIGVIIKGLDDIDNLRTMGDDVPVMEKTLGKIEAFLRHAEEFKEFLSLREEENEGFLTIYGALKEQIVEQAIARRIGEGFKPDSRYGHTLSYLNGKIREYSIGFGIDPEPIAKRLREQEKPLAFETDGRNKILRLAYFCFRMFLPKRNV